MDSIVVLLLNKSPKTHLYHHLSYKDESFTFRRYEFILLAYVFFLLSCKEDKICPLKLAALI